MMIPTLTLILWATMTIALLIALLLNRGSTVHVMSWICVCIALYSLTGCTKAPPRHVTDAIDKRINSARSY